MRTGQLEMTFAEFDAMARDGEWCETAAAWFASRPIGATFTAETLCEALGRPHGTGKPDCRLGAANWCRGTIVRTIAAHKLSLRIV